MADDRLDQLLEDHFLGDGTPQDGRELAQRLAGDRLARRRLVEQAMLEVLLYRACAASAIAVGVPAQAVAKARLSGWRPMWIAAAAALLLIGCALVFLLSSSGPEVRVLDGAVASNGATRGDVCEGRPFQVVGSTPAVLRLTDGSQATFEPATRAIVRGRVGDAQQVVQLDSGGGDFAVTKGTGTFRVDTPFGSVTALGTRFQVKLRERRNMSVAVSEGSVEVRVHKQTVVLTAGQSRTFSSDQLPPTQGPRITGTIVAVDAARRTITLQTGKESARETQVLAAPDAHVFVDGAPGKLADLPTGQRVTAQLSVDGRTVIEIRCGQEPREGREGPDGRER